MSPDAVETSSAPSAASHRGDTPTAPSHPFTGLWITADGHIRQELLPDGRYEEARGAREKAYTGRYTVDGNHIEYLDDTGFTATGDVRDGVLYHEHLVLYREGDPRILKSAAEGDG
ncbi:Atu4866 domain-containing protein [Streptomyces sp. NPDC057838]|uniref:Atu4866 domain-containing protein n=1 Tax=unclassified Streptomyces TaxID=2593676 RepID=UPI00368D0FD1